MTVASRELVSRGVHALTRSTTWWALGLGSLLVITAATWPSLEGSAALDSFDDMGSLLEAFGATDLASPSGYLDGQLYALMLPLLLSGMAIADVSALTAGDEDAGRLELLHALPLGRRTIWLARLGAALVAVGIVAALATATMLSARPAFSLEEVAPSRIAMATVGSAVLAAFHGAVAYAMGASGASRGRSVGVAVLVLVVGYVMSFIAPLSDTLAAVRSWSPWHWAVGEQPVSDGIAGGGTLLVVAVTVILVAVGSVAVERRDIRSP